MEPVSYMARLVSHERERDLETEKRACLIGPSWPRPMDLQWLAHLQVMCRISASLAVLEQKPTAARASWCQEVGPCGHPDRDTESGHAGGAPHLAGLCNSSRAPIDQLDLPAQLRRSDCFITRLTRLDLAVASGKLRLWSGRSGWLVASSSD